MGTAGSGRDSFDAINREVGARLAERRRELARSLTRRAGRSPTPEPPRRGAYRSSQRVTTRLTSTCPPNQPCAQRSTPGRSNQSRVPSLHRGRSSSPTRVSPPSRPLPNNRRAVAVGEPHRRRPGHRPGPSPRPRGARSVATRRDRPCLVRRSSSWAAGAAGLRPRPAHGCTRQGSRGSPRAIALDVRRKETAPADARAVGPGLLTPGGLHKRYHAHVIQGQVPSLNFERRAAGRLHQWFQPLLHETPGQRLACRAKSALLNGLLGRVARACR